MRNDGVRGTRCIGPCVAHLSHAATPNLRDGPTAVPALQALQHALEFGLGPGLQLLCKDSGQKFRLG